MSHGSTMDRELYWMDWKGAPRGLQMSWEPDEGNSDFIRRGRHRESLNNETFSNRKDTWIIQEKKFAMKTRWVISFDVRRGSRYMLIRWRCCGGVQRGRRAGLGLPSRAGMLNSYSNIYLIYILYILYIYLLYMSSNGFFLKAHSDGYRSI